MSLFTDRDGGLRTWVFMVVWYGAYAVVFVLVALFLNAIGVGR